jgi:hypothetical protein
MVTAPLDAVPAMPSDLVRQVTVHHRRPRAAIVGGAEPAAVAVDEKESIVLDDVIVPPVRDGKAIIVKVNKIGGSAHGNERPVSAKIELHIEFRMGVVLWRA